MTIRNKLIGILLLITLGVLCAAPDAQGKTPLAKKKTAASEKTTTPAPQAGPALEPKAIEILKAASSRLAAAHTLKFTSIEFFESSSSHGHPLSMTTKSEVTLQRPDKLRVITSADGPASEFYYDGKKMMAYAPAENLVAVADAPATIEAALEAAYHSAAIYFPFTDLIVADPYKDMEEGLKLAYYIGQSRVVGETTTDMLAYVDNDVFVQIWIGAEDKLRCLLHAIFLNDPYQLRYNLILSNWQLDPAFPADTFSSAQAASANPMPFAHPHPEPSPSAEPPAKGKPPKAQ